MSINIGDNNKIKNANIAEKLEINDDQSVKKSFYEKHPNMWILDFLSGRNRIIIFILG